MPVVVPSELASCGDGYRNEARAAAHQPVCVPGRSSATHGVPCLRRPAGLRHCAGAALKAKACGVCGRVQSGRCDGRTRKARDLHCGDGRVCVEFEVRRIQCKRCGSVKRKGFAFLADNPFYTQRLAYYVGRRCRLATNKDLAEELKLERDTVKTLE